MSVSEARLPPYAIPGEMQTMLADPAELELFKRWKEESAVAIHPEMDVNTMYDEKSAAFRDVWAEAIAGLRVALKQTDEETPDLIARSQDWESLIAYSEEAVGTYQRKGETSGTRKVFRDGQELALLLSRVSKMIPDQNGLSVLREGLLFIFDSWAKRIANASRVIEVLQRMPYELGYAQQLYDESDGNERMKLHVRTFLEVLVHSLIGLVNILNRRRPGKASIRKVLAKVNVDDKDARAINDILQALEIARKTMTEQSELLSRREQQAMLSGLRNDFERGYRELQSLVLQGATTSPQIAIFQTSVYQLLIEDRLKAVTQPRARTPIFMLDPSPSLTMNRLFEIVAARLPTHDVSEILRRSNHISSKALLQARELLTTVRFRSWLDGPGSDLLLVDGHCSKHSAGKVSPISVLCAGIVAAITQAGHNQVLHFYCSQPSVAGNASGGPKLLVRSLITQLLTIAQYSEPLLDFISPQYEQALVFQDLDVLMDLFNRLIHWFASRTGPESILYIILDSVSEFEGSLSGHRDAMRKVVQGLRSLVQERNAGAIMMRIKILMTSAERSIYLVQEMDKRNEHMSLVSSNQFRGAIPIA